jgi:hypothetical protein
MCKGRGWSAWALLFICGGCFLSGVSDVHAQQLPSYPAPPQQMPANVAPSSYPSTSEGAYPSRYPTYPSTNPMSNPPSYPATTPSAAQPYSPMGGGLPGIEQPQPLGGQTTAAANQGGVIPAAYDDPGPLYAPYGNPEAMTAAFETNAQIEQALMADAPWTWQILPTGLMYKSYLAGGREPRFASQWVHLRDHGWLWDATLGGRAGLIRYGTENDLWPQGWQLDIEGAAFPRMDLENHRDLICSDYRVGVPLTTRQGCWEAKFGYYHLSSHIGDEYLASHPGFPRINYVRDSLVLGTAFYFSPNLRLYGEAGWAFNIDGGARPWEFQCGADLSPAEPTGGWGAPFFAINGHFREENDFGGNMTVQTGWQWRGRSGHLCRIGMQYFNGLSDQYQFYKTFEEQIGVGLWYDF